jgi:hypothetical protein
VHVGFPDLDVVQLDERVELDVARSAALRTIWRCTWLIDGTSTTTSASIRAWHDRRRPGASGCRLA